MSDICALICLRAYAKQQFLFQCPFVCLLAQSEPPFLPFVMFSPMPKLGKCYSMQNVAYKDSDAGKTASCQKQPQGVIGSLRGE